MTKLAQGLVTQSQTLGRALMLPIAVLPAAGLLLRLGQPDVLDIAFVAAAGQAVFDNLGLLFAIGVAIGFAKANDGAAGLAGVVCYLVTTYGLRIFIEAPETLLAEAPETYQALLAAQFEDQIVSRLSVPIGIITGVTSGVLFNRFSDIQLPEYLGFFGGRRFVPMVAAVVGMVFSFIIGIAVEPINQGVEVFSQAVIGAGNVGLFFYGILNRLLLVTGLHHILNNIAWFIVGDYQGATGDLNRFFAGDPSAGMFMSGFFPIMMFGLPAACLAMLRAAPKEHRRKQSGLYGSMALTSFLTGVTEPVEFAFLFRAPALFALHAVLTGASMVVMHMLDVRLGFGFSAGLIDYVINFNAATKPLLLIPVGLAYACVYYVVFSVAIRKLGLNILETSQTGAADAAIQSHGNSSEHKSPNNAEGFIAALGGADNLRSVSACTTRLRLTVDDPAHIDEGALKALGAKAVVYPSEGAVQVILGPTADQTARAINAALEAGPPVPFQNDETAKHQIKCDVADMPDAAKEIFGGENNIVSLRLAADRRIIIELKNAANADDSEGALPGLIPVKTKSSSSGALHFLIKDFEDAAQTLGQDFLSLKT